MKFSVLSFSSLLTSIAFVVAAPGFEKRASGVVGISIYKNSTSATLRKRSSYIAPDSLQNEIYSYYFDFTLGTPVQQITAIIDTGSSDLIVYASGSTGSQGDSFYNSGSSSTYQYINNKASFSYGSGAATGSWVKDTLTINGGAVKIPGQQFADIQQGSTPNIVGIGFTSNEAEGTYPNLPSSLKSNGYIATNAYSLYLDDVDSSSGTILFGGLDTQKYTGPLVTLPIIYQDDENTKTSQPVAFFVSVKAIGGTIGGKTASLYSTAISALLDSGTTEVYVPTSAAKAIAKEFGFLSDGQGDYYKVLKDIDDTATINFKFGNNLTIYVPLGQAVVPAVDENGNPETDSNGNQYGILLVTSGTTYILGDSFLRSAYVVYDLDNAQVALAQSNFGSTASNIVAITSAGIPGAVAAT